MTINIIASCRNSTHSHVVRLLRGSGTRPTLVVASLESLEGSVRSTAPHPRGGGGVRKNTEAFKDKVIIYVINAVRLTGY